MRCEVEESDNKLRTTPNLPKLSPIYPKTSPSCPSQNSSPPHRPPQPQLGNLHGSQSHTTGHRPPPLMERVYPTLPHHSTANPTQSSYPSQQPHLTGQPSTHRPIPPVQDIEQRPPVLPSNLNAPNLTTYIHHVHHYTFNGHCTIYQSTDQANSGMPAIYAEPGSYTHSHAERRYDPHPGSTPAETLGGDAQPGRSQHIAPGRTFGAPDHANVQRFPGYSHDAGSSAYSPSPQDMPSPYRGHLPLPRVEQIAPPLTLGSRRYHGQPSLTHLEPPAKRRARPVSVPHGIGSAGRTPGPELSPLQTNPTQRFSLQQPVQAGTSSHDIPAIRSSTPSEDDHRVIAPHVRGGLGTEMSPLEQFHTSSTHTYSGSAEHENLNDWEHVVAMYMTGQGTPDGRPLKNLTKNDGTRVEDRKLLEKRRTIGKTYEKLGKALFEHAIGYKIDENTGLRKKQKMYHVIARCRVVNAIRKEGGHLPTDPDCLERLISQRIAQKSEMKHLQMDSEGPSQPDHSQNYPDEGQQTPHSSQPPPHHLPVPGPSYLDQGPNYK